MSSPRKQSRFARVTREAAFATPFMILFCWLSPEIYGVHVTLPRAICGLLALGVAEASIDERYPALERELMVLALGLVVSFGLAGLVELVLGPGSV
jgi:hypothetical protein